MKINDLKNKEIITIVCPGCGKTSEVSRVHDIKIDEKVISLHDAVGKIYRCLRPDCFEYLEKVNEEFKLIKMSKLIELQYTITDLLAKETELARARLVPSVVEAEIVRAEVGKLLSSTLYTLTAGSDFRRAYSVEEILEACAAVGLQPSIVDNATISLVVGWLEEHKGT